MTQFHHTGTGREMGDPFDYKITPKLDIKFNPKGEHWLYKKHKADNPKETPFSKYAFCFIIGMLAGAAVTTLYFISV